MADHEKRHLFLAVEDGLRSDSESGDYDVDEIAREVIQGTESAGRYRRGTEQSQHIRHSKNTRNQAKRICASLFTLRRFTGTIWFASLLALALLMASTIILCKRPYPWRKDLISTVFGVMSSAAIIILASFFYSIIHLLLIPCPNMLPTLANIVADVVLPVYLFQIGFGLLECEKGRWSYEGRDWCANPYHGGCNRLVYVLSILNWTAGYLAILIGFLHIGLLITRVITVFQSRRCLKANPHF